MGRFMLKETKTEIGTSLWNCPCPVGKRVNKKFRHGTIAIVYNEITQARMFVNREVLRRALLDNPDKTEKLLGIRVEDTRPTPVLVNFTPEELPAPIEPVEKTYLDPEMVVREPELVEPDMMIEDETEEIELEIPAAQYALESLTKAALIELAEEHDIEVDKKMTNAKIIEELKNGGLV